MSHFWEAATILKLEYILRVIAATSDGPCLNRRFCQVHNTITKHLYAIKASTSLQNQDILTFSQTHPFIKNRKEIPV